MLIIKLLLFYVLYLSLIYIIPKLTLILESLLRLEKEESQTDSEQAANESITVRLLSVNHEQVHRYGAINEPKIYEAELLPNSAYATDLVKFHMKKVQDKKSSEDEKSSGSFI